MFANVDTCKKGKQFMAKMVVKLKRHFAYKEIKQQ
jgi:hypothetical protein